MRRRVVMASEGWRLRAAAPQDAEALAGLIRLAFATQEVVTDPPPSALRETAGSVAALLARGGGLLAGSPPHGGLIWSQDADALYIGRLAVHPAWRRRSVARGLLAQAEAVARGLGLESITLSTRLVLAGNRALFRASGFVETTRHAHPGYDQPTFVAMEKRLSNMDRRTGE